MLRKGLSICLAMMMLVSCAWAEGFDLNAQARTACAQLLGGDYASVTARFDETLSAALSADVLAQTMDALALQYGALVQVADVQAVEASRAVVFTLAYEKGQFALTIAFNEAGQIAGLVFQPVQTASFAEKALPDGAVESAALLFEGTEREVNARLVRPAGADASTPWVVFVHGSGPSDLDETIGSNKPFRDLAYDLAALGVGSLRFDKITYAHPELPCETVAQEYLEPVKEALRVLRAHAGAVRAYVLGHSQGGMLTPWLVSECGFDGGIAMAGTPLALWEISYAQNLAVLELLPAQQREAQLPLIEAELTKAQALLTMTDEEAASATVFGASAVYQRSIAQLDEIALARESGKPFLFLWGDADVQVHREAFEAWQEGLGTDEAFAYIVYPGLNHLFLPAQEGETILNVQAAYAQPGTVDARVARDIAGWILP